jgi:predicted dehydrogenase
VFADLLQRTLSVSRKTQFDLAVGSSIQYKQENIIEQIVVPVVEPLRAEFEHFYESILSGNPIYTSGEMGLRALQLSTQIVDASKMVW